MTSKRKKPAKLTWVLIFIIVVLFLGIFGFFYQRKSCLSIDFLMCMASKQFVSKKVSLSFRYPNFFPMSKPNQEWEIRQSKDFGEAERLDFSKEFFFNAGGDRLGAVNISEASYSANLDLYEKELLTPITIFSPKAGKEITIPLPKVERVKIGNNIEALSITPDSSLALLARNSAEYVFFKNGLMYSITFNYNDYHHKLPKEQYFKGFDLILSTLQI